MLIIQVGEIYNEPSCSPVVVPYQAKLQWRETCSISDTETLEVTSHTTKEPWRQKGTAARCRRTSHRVAVECPHIPKNYSRHEDYSAKIKNKKCTRVRYRSTLPQLAREPSMPSDDTLRHSLDYILKHQF